MQDSANDIVFNSAFKALMIQEGGSTFTDDIQDPGGATKFGITLKTLRLYKNQLDLPINELFNMTEDQAKEICYNLYYKPLDLDCSRSLVLSTVLLDQAFNRGVGRVAQEIEQRLSPALSTRSEYIAYCSQHDEMRRKFCFDFILNAQQSYFSMVKQNPNLVKFLHGWINRTQVLLRINFTD